MARRIRRKQAHFTLIDGVVRPSRRQFLGGILGAAAVTAVLPGCARTSRVDGPDRMPPSDWLTGARVGGLEIFPDATDDELADALDILAEENVSVVEYDSDLSFYLSEAQFQEQLALFDRCGRAAHGRGMRGVIYYPSLEVLTERAESPGVARFSVEHADWLQRDIAGKVNMFVGGEGRVHWVDPGTESAWACPLTPYTSYFLDRVRRIAGTTLDGVWVDVPLFNDIVADFACTNEACRARFKSDLGLETPTDVNWDDPTFRRWVQWRHYVMWEFQERIIETAKKARPDFEVIVETVTLDYNAATSQGLDAAALPNDGLIRVWEVDVVSDQTGARRGTANDWMCTWLMMKFARGASYPRPAWTFAYGYHADDMERVVSMAISSGCGPFESRIPQMAPSADHDTRARMYGWIGQKPELYSAKSANRAAIVYVAESRDFLNRNVGVGLYDSLDATEPLWWSESPDDLVRTQPYLADWRGMGKLLAHGHIPFDVITVAADGRGTERLKDYALVAVPSAIALSETVMSAITAYADGGGTVVLTGPDLGLYDTDGSTRARPELLARFDVDPAAKGFIERKRGQGKVIARPMAPRLGADYFANEPAGHRDALVAYAKAVGAALTTDAPPQVLFELRDTGSRILLLCLNLAGLGELGVGAFNPRPATFSVTIPTRGRAPVKLMLSEPTAGASDRLVNFEVTGDGVRVAQLTVQSLLLLALETSPAVTLSPGVPGVPARS